MSVNNYINNIKSLEKICSDYPDIEFIFQYNHSIYFESKIITVYTNNINIIQHLKNKGSIDRFYLNPYDNMYLTFDYYHSFFENLKLECSFKYTIYNQVTGSFVITEPIAYLLHDIFPHYNKSDQFFKSLERIKDCKKVLIEGNYPVIDKIKNILLFK